MDTERIRRSYTAVADLYIALFGAADRVHADDLAFIGRHLAGHRGPVLDLGCGPGHLTAHLRALGADATGIDLVPAFIAHARATHPDGRYRLGSLDALDAAGHSVAGLLAFYSLIHLPPPDLHRVLTEFRRVTAPGGTLVLGFFEGPETEAFDHKVTTAYRYPVDEMSDRLARAGFTETDRLQRPAEDGHRPHAMLAAVAAER
ncbi:class I SAM-dependent methyltransferase [Catenuloplanes indicus]|uniref:SAM-dependent methyltransferase n=1 Tax=Catenuloplanes indicus TaxID=137267 RepID=A0AAE4B0B8_9ACTN|nr:class I SAM-dependent methyltransferase [Catenuloplanes indicus]MDQ0369439.1 SAM-dependent methyltransferase [Catenuloplanes indicus]